jgi:hypothetical protein
VKVSSTVLPPRQVSLAIEVEPERLDRAMDDAFRRLAGRVDVPASAVAKRRDQWSSEWSVATALSKRRSTCSCPWW